jgi:hypothetical protein
MCIKHLLDDPRANDVYSCWYSTTAVRPFLVDSITTVLHCAQQMSKAFHVTDLTDGVPGPWGV